MCFIEDFIRRTEQEEWNRYNQAVDAMAKPKERQVIEVFITKDTLRVLTTEGTGTFIDKESRLRVFTTPASRPYLKLIQVYPNGPKFECDSEWFDDAINKGLLVRKFITE